MDKMLETLLETYNTNLIDSADKRVQEALMITSRSQCDDGKGRTVLMDLICNHFNKSMIKPHPDFIGGPESLTLHWSEKYQKLIYIFGEHHTSEMNCGVYGKKGSEFMSVEYFLSELIRTTDVFLDIYFEFPAYRGKKYHASFNPFSKDLRMNKLLERFKTCLQYTTRSADECRFARIHYFDVRLQDLDGSYNSNNDISWYRLNVQYIIDNYPNSELVGKFKFLIENNPKIRFVLESLALTDDKKFLDFCKKQLYDNKYAMKEIGKIPSPLRGQILLFIEKEFEKQGKQHRKFWKKEIPNILKHKSKTDASFLEVFKNIYKYTTTLNSIIADAYALSRMFKDFDMADIEKKAYIGATDQPSRAHNIIIYAGDAHSERYREFLKGIGFIQVAKTGVLNNTCLDMRKFPQPFFSGLPPRKKSWWK